MSKFMRIAGAISVVFASLFCADYTMALDTDFHGRVQSTFVLRDYNGFQYGFMDEVKGVQWRNELKFEVTARPEYDHLPNFRVDKVYFAYRGAYDAIFDVVDRESYDAIREKSHADFELGRDDIETENDLREAFVDIVAQTQQQSLLLRLGRQIVGWGEADGFNVVNILNPQDNSVLMFFENPDDLATPLWMARLNYSKNNLGAFRNIGFEVVAIPDIRPYQWAPLDDTSSPDINCNSPYSFVIREVKFTHWPGLWNASVDSVGDALPYLRDPDNMDQLLAPVTSGAITLDQYIASLRAADAFRDLPGMLNGMFGYLEPTPVHIIEDVPDNNLDNTEIGLRLQAAYGSLIGSIYYFHGYSDLPALDLHKALTDNKAFLRHPELDMYGASFNVYLESVNAVLRGEGCMITHVPYTDLTGLMYDGFTKYFEGYMNDGVPLSADVTGYKIHKTYQSLIGFDKDIWLRWLNPSKMISMSYQAYWRHIEGWDNDSVYRPFDKQDQFRLTGFFYTDYHHGMIHPELMVMYDTENTWLTLASLKYSRDGRLFYKVQQISFWGDSDAISQFTRPAQLTRKSEISFRVGYNW